MFKRLLQVSIILSTCLCLFTPMGSCTVYHKARADLPPDGRERVALRLDQAGEAAKDSSAEIQRTADDLAANPPRLSASEAAGIAQSLAWELSRRAAAVGDAAGKTGVAGSGVDAATAALRRAVQRLDAAGVALGKGLPEGAGSLSDCREALDASVVATATAAKKLRAGPAPVSANGG